MAEILDSQEKIADFLGISVSKLKTMRCELDKAGVTFILVKGRPPRRRVCAVKSTLINWLSLKAEKGETI